MSHPHIGITTRNTTSQKYHIPTIASPRSYCEALVAAGAVPVLIPVNLPLDWLEEVLEGLDGLILTGGGDIETRRFNGEHHAEVDDVDPERDAIEICLIQMVCAGGKPFLGICRGIQVLNVALGGDLYTHLADQLDGAVEHHFFPGHPWDHPAHEITLEADSRLGRILGSEPLTVNSLHHQGIKTLAPTLKAAGASPDGLVEAVELPGHPFGLAVQWHPEWLPQDGRMRALFEAFVTACKGD